jgi:hypothetical protein
MKSLAPRGLKRAVGLRAVELALQAQENVALLAPMIGDIFYAPMRLHQFVFLMLHMKL